MKDISEMLRKHKLWLDDAEGGEKADLTGVNLRKADLTGADLTESNLGGANLGGADLTGANLRLANLTGADLTGANLRLANLRLADLTGADLTGAELTGSNLTGANLGGETLKISPIVITGMNWWVLITAEYLKIGCQRHTHAEWSAFDDDAIADMDCNALELWRVWREPLLSMCAVHRAQADKVTP